MAESEFLHVETIRRNHHAVSYDTVVFIGAYGPVGQQGNTGATGERGLPGPTGRTGVTGQRGSPGQFLLSQLKQVFEVL